MAAAGISASIAAFRAAVDLVKGAISARDDALVVKVISDMNERLMDVQSQCLALQEKHSAMADSERDLKEKLRKMEEKAADFDQYELHRNTQGALMYRSKHSLDATNQPVYLCANCIAAGIKTFLQFQSKGLATMLHCKEHGDIKSDIPNRTVQRHFGA